MPRRIRAVTPIRPHEVAEHHGLAYALWMPGDTTPRAGVVIIHGAGSCKERHHDFARAAAASGLAAVALDLPGHGASRRPLDAGVLDDQRGGEPPAHPARARSTPDRAARLEPGRLSGDRRLGPRRC